MVIISNSDCIWDGFNLFLFLLELWDLVYMDVFLGCIRVENCFGRVFSGDFDIDKKG